MGMHWNLLAASLYTFLLQCSLEASNNSICGRDDDVDDGDDVDDEMTTVLMIMVITNHNDDDADHDILIPHLSQLELLEASKFMAMLMCCRDCRNCEQLQQMYRHAKDSVCQGPVAICTNIGLNYLVPWP